MHRTGRVDYLTALEQWEAKRAAIVGDARKVLAVWNILRAN